MTAQELFNIVQDVPREAWPPRMENRNGFWVDYSPDEGGTIICHDHATLLFEASMVRFVCEKSTSGIEILHQSHKNSEMLWSVLYSVGWDSRRVSRPTLIEALAAACRVVEA